jgi:hypothetical protein
LPECEQDLRAAGQELFTALLGAGEVAGRYRAAAAVAAGHGQALRIVLRIDDPVLAALPWEAMYDSTAGAYVCRRNQLVRHVPVAAPVAPVAVQGRLRILGVVSSPLGLPGLDTGREHEQLNRAMASPAGQGLVQLSWAPDATWAGLQDLLLGQEWHVLHFIGHGGYDSARDEGVLALEGEDGRVDLVGAHRLVDLLHQARPVPRLVVLNSCSGAATGTADLFSGTAAALTRGGVSAVAAMQYAISDSAAVAFARGFYTAIARGRGIDDAVTSGRVAILGLSDTTLEWVTPVLYLRDHNARLFTLPASSGGPARQNGATEGAGRRRDTGATPAEGNAPADAAQASRVYIREFRGPDPRVSQAQGAAGAIRSETVTARVTNSSDQPVYDVAISWRIVTPSGVVPAGVPDPLGVLFPGEQSEAIREVPASVAATPSQFHSVALFRDRNEIRWRARTDGSIEEITSGSEPPHHW